MASIVFMRGVSFVKKMNNMKKVLLGIIDRDTGGCRVCIGINLVMQENGD